eukprot:TRINITY_DN6425_c0_g1_i1.p1 TRINITY_DN6425_c0_g1~~TRINITY_DN6425_c0_g1_i1.p1  ORF type:complete len:608 (+),score=141.30 TRINITY_DN6425_c0_g1_i1:18-1841(+)
MEGCFKPSMTSNGKQKQSSNGSELSYEDFLRMLRNSVLEPAPKRVKSPKDVYDELCYDFPLISGEDLQILKNDLLLKANDGQTMGHPFTKAFLNGITYGARRTSKEGEDDLRIYHAICGIVFVKYCKNMLRQDEATLEKIFDKYQMESIDVYPISEDLGHDQVVHQAIEEDKLAEEQDGDDYDYSYDSEDDVHQPLYQFTKKELPLKDKIQDYISCISYDLFASNEVWEELDIASDIIAILKILVTGKTSLLTSLKDRIPWFAFLLRDRMLQNHSAITELLPLTLDAIQANKQQLSNEKITPDYQFLSKVAVAIFGALTSQPSKPSRANTEESEVESHSNPKESINEVLRSIGEYQALFAQRTSVIVSEAHKLGHLTQENYNELQAISQILQFYIDRSVHVGEFQAFANALISSGMLRDLVQLFVKFGGEKSLKPCREILLSASSKIDAVISYLVHVPGFREKIAETEAGFVSETVCWRLVLYRKLLGEEGRSHRDKAVNLFETLTSGDALGDVSKTRELHWLLQFLASLKQLPSWKTFLGDRNEPFVSKLVELQKKVNEIKPSSTSEGSEGNTTETEHQRKEEKLNSKLVLIKQQLKDILQGGKAD